jgi:fructose-1,6-bisphosphatase/inositol monophosphatase family enzyme
LEDIRIDPAAAFETATIGVRAKPLLCIDLVAERNAARELHRRLRRYRPLVLGEESLRDKNLDLNGEKRLVVLIDMIDGTDLLERRLSNWCSAMVFYNPLRREIIAAFVGLPNDGIYFATKDSSCAFKCQYSRLGEVVPVTGPSRVETIEESSIAFYGQKLSAFSSVANNPTFLAYLGRLQHENATSEKTIKTRIYNLAGNPIAMRLIDGLSRVDAIFDLNGQSPHDIVPGAYIAQKAGALLCDPEGGRIDLNRSLLRPADPKSRIRYILASTIQLSTHLRKHLVGPSDTLGHVTCAVA